MPAPSANAAPYRPFLVTCSLVLVAAALYWAQWVLIPLALAVLITFILTPAVGALQRRGLKRVFAVVLTVLFALAVVGVIAWAFSLQVRSLANDMPRLRAVLFQKISQLNLDLDVVDNFQQKLQEFSDQVLSLGWLPQVVGPLLEVLVTCVLVLTLIVFMLMRHEDVRNRLIRLIGHGRLTSTTKALDDAAGRISKYLGMQLMINTGFGVVLGIGLYVIDVPYAFLLGLLAGALRFAPYVGIWLAIFPPLLLSLAIPEAGWQQPLLVLGLFALMELVTANVIEPLLFSHSTGVSPVALLVAVFFWSWLWGPIGLLLATPMTVCLAVLGRYVPTLGFLDVLLGDEPVLAANVSYYQRLLARDEDEASDLVEEELQHRPPEAVCDELVLPALVFARRDRERGELSEEEENYIYRATQEILERAVFPQEEVHRLATEGVPGSADEARQVLVLGCPARGRADELALEIFRRMIESPECRVHVLSSKTLSAEVVDHVRQEHPAVVVIAALPPGGVAQARYLCKRLRSQAPDLKIVVGRWGQKEAGDKLREALQQAGADFVGITLEESRCQVVPLVQAVLPPPPRSRKPEPQPATAGRG